MPPVSLAGPTAMPGGDTGASDWSGSVWLVTNVLCLRCYKGSAFL